MSLAAGGEGARKGNPAFPLKIYHALERLSQGETSLSYGWIVVRLEAARFSSLPCPLFPPPRPSLPPRPARIPQTYTGASGAPLDIRTASCSSIKSYLLTYSLNILISHALKVPLLSLVMSKSLLLLLSILFSLPVPLAPWLCCQSQDPISGLLNVQKTHIKLSKES